jgi:hypothetical protein
MQLSSRKGGDPAHAARSARSPTICLAAFLERFAWVTHQKMRHGEKELAAQAQASYKRMVRDWKAAPPKENVDASVTADRARFDRS